MRFTMRFKDEGGWPMMYCEQLMQENRDSLRIQNYALQRFNDFNTLCQLHRQATKDAKQAVKEGKTTKNYSIGSLFHDIFIKEDNEKIVALEKEVKDLKEKLRKYESQIPAVTGC